MLAMATLVAGVYGHGYMTEPAVTFLSSSTDNTQFIATIESSASGFSGTFSGSPADNTAAFTTAFDSSKYTSLKELINDLATITVTDATLTCGSCDPDETAQPLPETYVEWSHSSSEGFTSSHEGPCEVWCDDVRVFQDKDCAADYTSAPAELPYDHDACLGTSTLTFYWLALHSSTWQVYVNCAPLETTTSTGAVSSYAVSATSFSAMLATAVLAAGVNGHGYMSDPAVTFLTSNDPTQFIATIEASDSGLSGTFNGAPADNTAAFTTAFESSSYSSLKEFINDKATITVTDATLTCGSCDPDEAAQALPDTYVEWAHSDSEGFTASHEGPCEVWCDDTRVFQDDDCAADYTTAPAQLPFDHDACLGSSTVTLYWLALHSSTWQVYVNCAPLETTTSTGATSKYAVSGASTSTSTSKSTSSNSTTTTTSTAASTAGSASYNFNTNYATSTSASTGNDASTTAAGSATTSTTTTAPIATIATPITATTDAPTTEATDAPATSTDTAKCSVRRRRN
ncbi:hypothetical protein BBO99_00007355 [Phytophthora kernoviae]|uniref:Uncharacterized protein n=2 Tax=Phytophthora kernoviae TaxID=325452 RepID=A0A3R7JDU6_9STRA|nr:hypothetical protein G195_008231 [Phytophthora kernoviae 00238/432]KAG2519802.1 hypothetical protein JM16_006839 [Phytophthora kernoviae]KAG2520927.1 hypothetical protein JM18_006853 [Phytophthora kernoviae]RLN38425.1 hypothetical protein BBI17_007309 [Phytophthora kernoviae]RLN76682.1 hypothetical protein BBO99_00007355 [Phytophthora kernoviae]